MVHGRNPSAGVGRRERPQDAACRYRVSGTVVARTLDEAESELSLAPVVERVGEPDTISTRFDKRVRLEILDRRVVED